MKLSVVIVNYNVEYFLEQCLLSVEKARAGLDTEVFMVDNHSVDGSVAMVRQRFPNVIVIANQDNVGFSRANNQAMRMAKGEYILLLNPDTIVEEDTFRKVITFMDQHPDAGGLGVKMIDGKGVYLPESKRGLPTPETAFYKIFGISGLFPKSAKFNRYYLGNLSPDETNEIEILSGAFMLMRKSALDKVGLLDEQFFMYGEDIDLSWRIILGGYKNYYFPETRIIHYKGESTKKGSLNYVFVFYKAMIIFAEKHFSHRHARLFGFFINLAVYLRAALAIVSRFIRSTAAVVLDAGIVLGGLFLIKSIYQQQTGISYPSNLVLYAFLVYTIIWLTSLWIFGGYDRPYKVPKILKGAGAGTLVILIGYSLLPEYLRFSRAILLLGSLNATLAFFIVRGALSMMWPVYFRFAANRSKRYAIVGLVEEVERVQHLLNRTGSEIGFIAAIAPDRSAMSANFIGTIEELPEVMRVHRIDEVVYCARDLSAQTIMGSMSILVDTGIDFKIAPPESLYIIGSNSVQTPGDLFVLDVNSVNRQANRRTKRIFDVVMSVILLIFSPILIFINRSALQIYKHLFLVLFGKRSWVGYAGGGTSIRLPALKKGILSPLSALSPLIANADAIDRLNVIYAKDYSLFHDLRILWKGIQEIGRV